MNSIAPHMLKCNLCKGDDPFRCPNDAIGIIFMTEHLKEVHDIEAKHVFS